MIDPLSYLRQDIESIGREIRDKKEKYSQDSDSASKNFPRIWEKMTALKILQPLEKRIDQLKARKQSFNLEEMIHFNSEEIYFTLIKAINLKSASSVGD